MSPIAINRARASRALRQMAEFGRARINQGFWIVIFPEGTRTAPGEKAHYKVGGAWLAKTLDLPVLPIAHNAGLFWKRNAFVKRPGVIQVCIGPLITSTGKTPESLNQEVATWIELQMNAISPQ